MLVEPTNYQTLSYLTNQDLYLVILRKLRTATLKPNAYHIQTKGYGHKTRSEYVSLVGAIEYCSLRLFNPPVAPALLPLPILHVFSQADSPYL